MSLIWFPHCSELLIANVQASFTSGETVQSVLALSQFLIKSLSILYPVDIYQAHRNMLSLMLVLGTPRANLQNLLWMISSSSAPVCPHTSQP